MAPKRPAPAELPPPAESSDEEEASSESTRSEEDSSDSDEPKATQPKAPQPKLSSAPPPRANSKPQRPAPSSGSESESESESDPDEPKGKPLKNSQPTALANAKPQKSAPESDSESESESESDVTPLAAKPVEGQSTPQSKKQNLKRPRSELTVAAEDAAKTPSKKPSNVTSRGSQNTGEESSKKPHFQRVWSEEDGVTLLEGMIEYWEKRDIDPSANIISFHEFIRERLRLDAVPSQLANKIRHFKKKFKKNEAKAKNAKEPIFAKPNLQRAFDLSKKLWDSEHGIMTPIPKANANGSALKKKKSTENTSSAMVIPLLPQRRVKDEDDKATVKAETCNSDANGVSLCECELSRFSNGRVDDSFLRKGLCLISDSKMEELEERWKKVNLAELHVLSEQALMIHEQINLIIDAYKKT